MISWALYKEGIEKTNTDINKNESNVVIDCNIKNVPTVADSFSWFSFTLLTSLMATFGIDILANIKK